MTIEIPGRRRMPLCAAIAGVVCLFAGAALALETAPHVRRELVPTGSSATIRLEAASTPADTVSQLTMEKGKSVFVRTGFGVSRVSVGDPKVADVVVLRTSELQIVARDVGTTNVVIWGSS